MKIYERKYNFSFPGLFIIIKSNKIEIVINRYNPGILAEMYYDTIEVNPDEMKVILVDKNKRRLSTIYNVQRITDMRSE